MLSTALMGECCVGPDTPLGGLIMAFIMFACCCWAAVVGTCDEPDMLAWFWNGGRGFKSYGGGGRLWLSPAVGELLLFLVSETKDGENAGRKEVFGPGHPGVKPVWYPLGVVPECQKVGVYGRTP